MKISGYHRMGSKRTERSLQEIVVGFPCIHSASESSIGCYSATLESICSYGNPSITSLTNNLFVSPLSLDGHQWCNKFSSRFMPAVVFFNTTCSTWMLEGYLAPAAPLSFNKISSGGGCFLDSLGSSS